ncbi:type II toxin-antitoxin system Phd/YefM family antitoxin [Mongoliimonas terrestris]|uniref:type II toxin-antitoxin system Phd/YefM family antitoxin n=1 Tax=Mongoliimonas terrestris TaxID=1709001 RepID=UPI0009495698|nr:type II toxin-antitoxin system prevent-host-death family antitoxin [Mongoliimonas terrestris]
MSDVVNLEKAKSRLSSLVDRAAGGEEIVIARNGKPVARLVPLPDAPAVAEAPVQRKPAHAFADVVFHDTFDDPLPDDVLKAFQGLAD